MTEAACRYCHQAITASISHGETGAPEFDDEGRMVSQGTIACTRCHDDVGHATH